MSCLINPIASNQEVDLHKKEDTLIALHKWENKEMLLKIKQSVNVRKKETARLVWKAFHLVKKLNRYAIQKGQSSICKYLVNSLPKVLHNRKCLV